MNRFFVAGQAIELPAVLARRQLPSRDASAWLFGGYVTVCLLQPLAALRVHTAGRGYEGREASGEAGAWLLLGDVIMTASQLADSRALPVDDPRRMVAFTHVSAARVAAGSVLHVGRAAAKFGGRGGGWQAEFVSGPPIVFSPFEGKHWHGRAGLA